MSTSFESHLDFTPYKPKRGEDYMSKEQGNHFKKILEGWEQTLIQEAQETLNYIKTPQEMCLDEADLAVDSEIFRFNTRARDRERKLLKKIKKSLSNIKSGDYGYCEDCGEEIGIARLEARPTATKCIECKIVSEIKEKQVMS